MYYLIGVGLIGLGFKIQHNVYNDYKNLNNKIKNEKIYEYPKNTYEYIKNYSPQNYTQYENPNEIIVKIPADCIDKKYSIGEIKIEKITKHISTIFECDKNKIIIKNKEIKHKEPFLQHILFPTTLFDEFEIKQRTFNNEKIKVLFDNSIISKSSAGKTNLIDKYIKIIENNYGNCQSSNIFLHTPINSNYEMEENFIENGNDLYLIVKPNIKFSTEQKPNIKLDIVAMGDDVNKIVEEKYDVELREIGDKLIFSCLSIASGFILFFALQKN